MARSRNFGFRMLLVLALMNLVISLQPVLITARTVKSTDFETTRPELNQTSHLRRIDTGSKRRTRTRRMMMNFEEINDYPGSGANDRHTPHCSEC